MKIVRKNSEKRKESSSFINPSCEPLQVESLRELCNLDELSDEQAERMVQAIRTLASLLVQHEASRLRQQVPDSEQSFKQAA